MINFISTSNGAPVIYAPLSLIILVSGLKDLFEDNKRKKDDNRENSSKTLILTEHGFQPRRWREIRVGDIIKVQDGEFIPADIVLLKTSEENGINKGLQDNLNRNLLHRN
jgi:phospholipid-transporting ATPase